MPIETSPRAGAPRTVPSRVTGDDARTEVLANQDGQAPWGGFYLATVMFQRARQLKGGSRPRVDVDGHKTLRVAFLEITSGAVPWKIHTGAAIGGD